MSEQSLSTADTTTDQAAAQTAEGADQQVDTTAQQPADDAAKTEGDKSTAEGDDAQQEKTEGDKEDDAPKGAPEAYEDFAVPEGVELDAEVLGKFKDVAKELNLPQDAAQKVTDLAVEMSQKWATAAQEQTQTILDGWREAAENDKEFGGAKLAENLSLAKQASDKFGTPEFRQMLDEYRMGDHPEMIRFLLRVAKSNSEDTFVAGGPAQQAKSAANVLFPDMK